MKLNQIADNPGARKNRMRIGRGIGSGMGKTGRPAAARARPRVPACAIKGFERRPDAAASAPAEARLPQHLVCGQAQRDQSRQGAEKRSMPACSTPRRRSMPLP